jgi:diadenosine tetraphosphatase ApaH/serine/threonine PP2A family protein phosphatase
MRIGILGDIHANLEALTAVVAAMRNDGVDTWVQVGDIVGYGPEPSACIDLVRELGCLTCLGNHDAAALGLLDIAYFNNFARQAMVWTRAHLRASDFEFLRNLPLVIQRDEFTVVHGSLHLPEQYGYVISSVEAREALDQQQTRLCFVGHSHAPAVYMRRTPNAAELVVCPQSEIEISYRDHERVLVNVGSVGQPRDEDPRAAYGLVDTEQQIVHVRRVPYDIAAVQAKIRSVGLPEVLANRLSLGV